YVSTPNSSTSATSPNLIVTDISKWRSGAFRELVKWNGNAAGAFPNGQGFSSSQLSDADVRLHSMDVSTDGTRVYIAYLGGGLVILDSSALAAGTGTRLTPVAAPSQSPQWDNIYEHTAEKIPGRDLLLATDELYGDILTPIEL